MTEFQDSLEALVQKLVEQGYTQEQAKETVNKMFSSFGVEVK